MSIRDPKVQVDGQTSMLGGMDSGLAPNLIAQNQVALAINTTSRGGLLTCRPSFTKHALSFNTEDIQTGFQDGRFQGATIYNGFNGKSSLIAAIGGRLFQISENDVVTEITPLDDPSSSTQPQVWFCQAEEFLIVQDNQSRAVIFDGASSRRSSAELQEIPVGNAMEYANGRIWFAFPNRRSFGATDIVYGPSGTATYGYRDAVYKYTENTFLNEGGTFTTGMNSGEINAIRAVPTIDASLGQGLVQVFTNNTVFSVNAPLLRDEWKDVRYPIQTVSLMKYGALAQNSTTLVNGDIWYRSTDGIRSFQLSRRDFKSWSDTPQSTEMTRLIDKDDVSLLRYSSSVLFDNRLLVTVSPMMTASGCYWRGLAALDFDSISSLTNKTPPCWDGLWTGVNILQAVVGTIGGVERCYLFVLSAQNKIELWELLKDGIADNDTTPIQQVIETRSFNMGDGFNLKKLNYAEIFVDQLQGDVEFAVSFRPDQHPCWLDWHEWDECAKIRDCTTVDSVGCQTLPVLQPQYRSRMRTPTAPETCLSVAGRPANIGYEFQLRLVITGYCRLRQIRLFAYDQPQEPFGECRPSIVEETPSEEEPEVIPE